MSFRITMDYYILGLPTLVPEEPYILYNDHIPRQKRLDVLGIVHHVVTRGIDKIEIFKDNADRGEFLSRLAGKKMRVTS